MARVVPIKKYSESKFINPFLLGKFKFFDKEYTCDDHMQTLLYFWVYGLNTSKKICSLFKIYNGHEYINLTWRKLAKTVFRIHQTEGWVHLNEYTTCMDLLYRDALENNIILPYIEDKEIFFLGMKTTWDSWVKLWIYKNFPNIIKELKIVYPDINIFF